MTGLFSLAARQAMEMSEKKPDPMRIQAGPFDIEIPMAGGGGISSVQKNINIKGQPHELSYITPGESDLLKQLGGSGRNVDGIPAYDTEGYDDQGNTGGTGGSDEAVDEGEATGPGQGEQGALSDRGALTDFFDMDPATTSKMGWGNPGWQSDVHDALNRSLIARGLMQKGESALAAFTRETEFTEEDPGYLGYGPDFDPVTTGFPYDPMNISQRRKILPRTDYGDLGPLASILSMYQPESYNPVLGVVKAFNQIKEADKKKDTEKAVQEAIDWEKEKSVDLLKYADIVQKTDPRLADDLRGRVQDNINKETFSLFGVDPSFAKKLSNFGLATHGKGLWKKGERRTPFAMTKTEKETYLEPKAVDSKLGTSITRFEQIAKDNPNLSVHTVLDKYNKERDTYHTAPLNIADLAGYGYKGPFAAGPQVEYSRRQRVKGIPGPSMLSPTGFSKLLTGKTPGGHFWKAAKEIFRDIVQGVEGEGKKVSKGVQTVEDAIKDVKNVQSKVEEVLPWMSKTGAIDQVRAKGMDRLTNFLLDNLIGKDRYTPETLVYEEEEADLIKNKWKPMEGKAYSGQGISQLPYLNPDYIKNREAHMLGKYNISPIDAMGLSGRGKFYHRGKQLSKEEQDELLNRDRQSTSWPRWKRATGGLVTLLPDDRDPSTLPPIFPDPPIYPKPPPIFPDPPPPEPPILPDPPIIVDPPTPPPTPIPPDPEPDDRSPMQKYYNIQPDADFLKDDVNTMKRYFERRGPILNPNYSGHQLAILKEIYPDLYGDYKPPIVIDPEPPIDPLIYRRSRGIM